VHRQHAAAMPELAPYVDDRETWDARRVLYAELLAKPDTTLLLAVVDRALVGTASRTCSPVLRPGSPTPG
jgi:hypothetical protein